MVLPARVPLCRNSCPDLLLMLLIPNLHTYSYSQHSPRARRLAAEGATVNEVVVPHAPCLVPRNLNHYRSLRCCYYIVLLRLLFSSPWSCCRLRRRIFVYSKKSTTTTHCRFVADVKMTRSSCSHHHRHHRFHHQNFEPLPVS